MDASELSKLSRQDLLELQERVERALRDQEQQHRNDALKAARAAAEQAGFTLDDLMHKNAATVATRKPRAASTTTYVNPADGAQTWNGRGRPPVWFREALENGAEKADLLQR